MRYLLLGVLVSLGGLGHLHPSPLRPHGGSSSGVEIWAVDRARGALVGMDRQLYPAQLVRVTDPTRLVRVGRYAWAACALEGSPDGSFALVLVDDSWMLIASVVVPPVVDMVGLVGGGLVAILGERGAERVVQLDLDARVSPLFCAPGACFVAAAGGRIAIANRVGELWSFELDHGPAGARLAQLGGAPSGLAPAGKGCWWWLEEAGRLSLLDPDLRRLWSRETETSEALLAASASRAWALERFGSVACAFDSYGNLKFRCELPVAGFEAALPLGDGELLSAGPGSVFHLNAEGRVVSFQGGFLHLVGLAH